MKKKRKKGEENWGEGRFIYTRILVVCARLQLSVLVCDSNFALHHSHFDARTHGQGASQYNFQVE
jgi:hypothetical protein